MDKITEITLQQLRIECTKTISSKELERFCNDLRLNTVMPEMIDGMVIQLSGWVWAKKPDRKEVITGLAMVPRNWFEHLKFDLFSKVPNLDKFLGKVLPNKIRWYFICKMKTIEIKREIELQTFYPTLNMLSHKPYITLVELETDKGNWYEESK